MLNAHELDLLLKPSTLQLLLRGQVAVSLGHVEVSLLELLQEARTLLVVLPKLTILLGEAVDLALVVLNDLHGFLIAPQD